MGYYSVRENKIMPEEQVDGAPVMDEVTQQGDGANDDAGRRGGDTALKADLAKERRARQALEARLQEAEDAKLSDLERAKKEAADAQRDVTAARTEALRYRIAAKHGIGDEDAELFLTGSDEARITAQAQRLVARDGAAPIDDGKGIRKAPRPDHSQGSHGADRAAAIKQQTQEQLARLSPRYAPAQPI